jgi:hypothetical protein
LAARKGTVLFRATIKFAALIPLFAGCASVKQYQEPSKGSNLIVKVHIEEPGFLERKVAGLFVYEVRSDCEWFNYGLVDLKQGENQVSLPIGKSLAIEYVRVNAFYGSNSKSQSSHTLRFQSRPGNSYKLTARERNGSREVFFYIKDGNAETFREYKEKQNHRCEKLEILE